MTRQEAVSREKAVRTISRISGSSVSYAEDLYDSFFPKPVVPQYVADWYEGHKDEFEINLYREICRTEENYECGSLTDFQEWLISGKTNPFSVLVNMHQFGYEVEKEKRYRVSMPKTRNRKDHAQLLCEADGKVFWCGEWYKFRTKFTRKELVANGFGWVFDCTGVEVKEVE